MRANGLGHAEIERERSRRGLDRASARGKYLYMKRHIPIHTHNACVDRCNDVGQRGEQTHCTETPFASSILTRIPYVIINP